MLFGALGLQPLLRRLLLARLLQALEQFACHAIGGQAGQLRCQRLQRLRLLRQPSLRLWLRR